MAQAELGTDGRIAVTTSYAEKDLIRAVPGSRWDPNAKVWHVPQSWAACKALRGIFSDRLTIGPLLTEWAWEELRTRVTPATELRMATEAEGEERLYPFQRAGVKFLSVAEQAILADEMGTGKTVQTIRTVRNLQETKGDAFPVCVICPNSMKLTWDREWTRWDDGRADIVVVGGSADKRRKQFAQAEELIAEGKDVVVIINWEGVRGHSRLAPYGSVRLSDKEKQPGELNRIPFRTVVADEAHRMKEPKAKQTRATWAVQHGETVKYRYSLTGTPIANHPGDLWSLLHGIAPGDFPTKTAYIDRYCLQSWNPFGGLDIIGVRPDTKEEFQSVVDPRMRRMPKELVLPFLPKKVRQIRYCSMSSKQAKAYRDIESQMATKLDDGSIILTTNNLAVNTRLLQFSSSYATVDDNGDVKLADEKGTATTGPNKLDTLMEIAEDMAGESFVVAAESKQLIELAAARLEKAGYEFRKIVGGMTDSERQQNIDDFQNGHAQIMLMTLKAGGVGLTLTRAGVIVFLQRSWSMIDNKQGEDRVHRIGSEIHDKITVIDLVTSGTIEETQIPKLHEKLARLQEIVRDREVMAANGNTEAVARLDAEMAAIEQTPLWTGA